MITAALSSTHRRSHFPERHRKHARSIRQLPVSRHWRQSPRAVQKTPPADRGRADRAAGSRGAFGRFNSFSPTLRPPDSVIWIEERCEARLDVEAWCISDERVLRRLGFERGGRRVLEQAAADEYRWQVSERLAAVSSRARGLTWSRERFPRARNFVFNLPDSLLGQLLILTVAYPRSRAFDRSGLSKN